jgi:hypothetical protein
VHVQPVVIVDESQSAELVHEDTEGGARVPIISASISSLTLSFTSFIVELIVLLVIVITS